MPRETLADLAAELADYENLYRLTGSPLYVWCAISRTAVVHEIPDWCQQYLADRAADITRIAYDQKLTPKERLKAAASALGMGGQGKNWFADFGRDAEADATATHVEAQELLGWCHKAAVMDVANALGVSTKTVYERLSRTPDLQVLQGRPLLRPKPPVT